MKLGSFAIKPAAIVAMALLAVWPAVSAGSVIVSLNNPGSTTLHEVQVAPGASFSAEVILNISNDTVYWASLYLKASTSGVFDVISITDVPPWQSYNPTIVGGVDPISGRLATRFYPGFEPGVTTVASLQISIDAQAPIGTYMLDVYDPQYVWSMVIPEGSRLATPGSSFVVQVIPEPASLMMILALGLFPARRWFSI